MTIWNPWRGCVRYSEGCRYCYIHKGDKRKGIDTSDVVKTKNFSAPYKRNKDGEYKIKKGSPVYVCFSSDFFIEQADGWRDECWEMMRLRSDLNFLFLTKRIARFYDVIPNDWADGYDNVIIGCTVENQKAVDERLPVFVEAPVKHKIIICQPLISRVDLSDYLDSGIESVVVGGESDMNARAMNYDWVLDIRNQCINASVSFEFR